MGKSLDLIKMLLSEIWVLSSAIALLTGLTMVLVFCQILIVPYLETQDYVSTHCAVEKIQAILMEENGNGSCSNTNSSNTTINQCNISLTGGRNHAKIPFPISNSMNYNGNYIDSMENDYVISICIQVTVSYPGFDGFIHTDILQLRPAEPHQYNTKVVIIFYNYVMYIDPICLGPISQTLQSTPKETHIKFEISLCPPEAGGEGKYSHARLCKWEFYTCSNFSFATVLKIFYISYFWNRLQKGIILYRNSLKINPL